MERKLSVSKKKSLVFFMACMTLDMKHRSDKTCKFKSVSIGDVPHPGGVEAAKAEGQERVAGEGP